MHNSQHDDFLQAWFPSLAGSSNPAAFFHAYNDFLGLSPVEKRVVLGDKLLLAAALSIHGITTPTTLLVISAGRFVSPLKGEISEEAARDLLRGKDAFIKSSTGWGGFGAFRLHANGDVYSADGSKMRRGLPRLFQKIRGAHYLVQEVIQQDPRYTAVAPASVNTIRCVTFRDRSGEIHVAAASWRMGDGKSVVDNSSSGGIVCGIDPATGTIIGRGRDLSGKTYTAHPATGFVFEGADVPDAAKMFETAKAAHRGLGTAVSVGWDVVMTIDGPMILEGNDPWGALGHALVDRQFLDRAWGIILADHKVAGTGFPSQDGRIRRNDLVRATLSIRGKVQGVGYRKWVSRYAAERGVDARPENLSDGTVRCQLVGQRWRVEFVTLACHRGPGPSRVEKIEVQNVRRL